MRNGFNAIIGIISSVVTYLLGGWSGVLQTLLLFMILDYLTGVIVAAFFQNSSKSASGGLSSVAGFKGLFKKIAILIAVIVGHHIDTIMQCNGVLLMAVEYGFIANEGISILENISAMGINLPAKLVKALDVLHDRSETEE